jgi:hypothetical protein
MVNIARRHMTKGQQPMVAARALRILQDENESGRKPTSIRQTAKTLSMSHERIVAANMVLDYAPPSPTRLQRGSCADHRDASHGVPSFERELVDGMNASLARIKAAAESG